MIWESKTIIYKLNSYFASITKRDFKINESGPLIAFICTSAWFTINSQYILQITSQQKKNPSMYNEA